MEAVAHLRYARMSPRKVQIVMDLIRNQPAETAVAILKHTPRAACEPVLKLLQSAIANAQNNFDMDKNQLFPTVIKDGSLPRKTFSMGHAEDKRFYIECRKIK